MNPIAGRLFSITALTFSLLGDRREHDRIDGISTP